MKSVYACGDCGAQFRGTRRVCSLCGNGIGDTTRGTCKDCGSILTESAEQRCPACGSTNVERVSVDAD
jgi:RNA polymerase subunit RPABC4/transcription elongation factor Spt4